VPIQVVEAAPPWGDGQTVTVGNLQTNGRGLDETYPKSQCNTYPIREIDNDNNRANLASIATAPKQQGCVR